MPEYVVNLNQLNMSDLGRVGGKNASLGEMISHLTALGVKVPGGFATTADAYREFLQTDGLGAAIDAMLADLNADDIKQLQSVGQAIRQKILDTPFQAALQQAIVTAYTAMQAEFGDGDFSVAVRSSATAEDLPDASFAGQQETYLNVHGAEAVVRKVHEVYASLYNDRAISYRVHHGFEHSEVAISAGVQLMVRSDLAASGVMFTLDTESGFDDVVFITSAYGLGETVVQGAVNPDEFYVFKPALKADRPAVLRRNLGSKHIRMHYGEGGVQTSAVDTQQAQLFSIDDSEVQALARMALQIEAHYGRPMDIEWAKDGVNGQLYIVQARPETVKSRDRGGQKIERYHLQQRGEVLCEGRSIGQKIGSGRAKVIASLAQMDEIQSGDVLITDMTDPDWEPIMKKAAAIVTNRGGRTCHAAIIARELGIPAIVGCVDATDRVPHDLDVTVSCCEGDTGFVYAGLLPHELKVTDLASMPEVPIKIMLNVGNPDKAFDFSNYPNAGIGLARLEFIINRMIGIHPQALLEYDQQPEDVKQAADPLIRAYPSPRDYYVMRLAEGIATLAAAFHPKPVIVRLSDFKSNEYANLIGGRAYEPHEENPMLGFRGASRYVDPSFEACFAMECEALKYIRDDMGLTNVWAMVPFVRTLDEGRAVIKTMEKYGLSRSQNGLKIIMMCELPSNALLADEFLDIFDGFSIGSNDLTQLTLGLDRDSGLIANLFDERDPAVKKLLTMAIQACRKKDRYVGICGQGPSDHADLAEWLLAQGIGSISLNPDTVVETWLKLAKN